MSRLVPVTAHVMSEANRVHPAPSPLGTRASSGVELKKWTQWSIIAHQTGVQATKERLKSYWTTLGVVSALMAALTYPAVTSPAVTKYNGSQDVENPLFIAYVLLNTTSLLLSFVVVIVSVVLLAECDLVITDSDLEIFIERYQALFILLTAVFGCSMISIIASIVVLGFFNYTKGTAIATAAIIITGTVFVAIVSAWLALWTRSRLKHHITEANALLKNVVAKLRKGTAGAGGGGGSRESGTTATGTPASAMGSMSGGVAIAAAVQAIAGSDGESSGPRSKSAL